MKKPDITFRTNAATLAHRFATYGASLADLADKLVAEFALLQTAAIELQQAAPGETDGLYATQAALNDLLAQEFQRLGAPWASRPVMGRHTIPPLKTRAADIADAVVERKTAYESRKAA